MSFLSNPKTKKRFLYFDLEYFICNIFISKYICKKWENTIAENIVDISFSFIWLASSWQFLLAEICPKLINAV